MKRVHRILGGVVALGALSVSVHAVDVFRLDNGLTILVESDRRLPLVNVSCLYKVGSSHESPGITGVAHYAEHMNFRATANVSQADITGFINRVGGRWNGYTSLEQTLYAATVPSWAMEEIFRIEADRMVHARFDPAEFDRERTSVIAELQGYQNDPGSRLWDLGVATALEIHPYRYNIIGWLDDVLALTRDRAYRFYKDYYGPNNAVLAVVGDTDGEEVRKLATRYFGPLEKAPQDARIQVVEPPQMGEKRASLVIPASGRQVLLLQPAPGAADPDFAVLMVLDALLAGGRDILSLPGSVAAGPSGRLARRLASYGVTAVETALTPTRSPYLYGIRLHLAEEADLERLLSHFLPEVVSLLESLTGEELDGARHRLQSYQAYASDELAERAHRLVYFEGLGSWQIAGGIEGEIARVNRSELRSYASRWLQERQRTVAILQPGDLGLQERQVPAATPGERALPLPSPVPDRAFLDESIPLPSILRSASGSGPRLAAATTSGLSTTLIVRLGLGSRFDPAGKEGLALLCAEILERRPDLWARLDRLGAERTSSDFTNPGAAGEFWETQITFLNRDTGSAVPLLAEALSPPQLTEELLQRVRQELEEKLETLSQDATWRARQEAVQRLAGGVAAGIGTRQSRSSLRLDDVRAFLREHFHSGRIWAVITGPDPAQEELDVLRRVLERIPRAPQGRRPEPFPESPAPGQIAPSSPARIALAGKTQAEIYGVLPIPGAVDSDRLALRMLNYILGETGYAGRLGRALVDQGLTYSVYAELPEGRLPGLWTIETGAAPSNLDTVLKTIGSEVARLAGGDIQPWELREAQAYLLGKRLRRLEAGPGVASWILENLYLDQDPKEFRRRILAIRLDDLKEAAARHLRPQALSLAAAGAVSPAR